MTPPTEAAVLEAVGKLTKGQREAIICAARRVEGWEVTGRSANSLGLKGLVLRCEFRSLTGKSRYGLALTPLGLAVRSHLMEAPNAD